MAEFVLVVNGREHRVTGEAGDSLLAVLRDDLGLSGSKFGCGEGYCGACTVLIDGQVTRSCVAKLGAVAGQPITTIESIGTPEKLHPVQQAFCDKDALMCGFCTPGFIMASVGLLEKHPNPTPEQIKKGLDGNICRCGTFTRIMEAATSVKGVARG